MRGAFVAIVGGLTVLAAAAACNELEGFSGGDPLDGGGTSDGVGGGGNDADTTGDGGAQTDAGGNGCPTGRGPTMVRVGKFCIDSTEITQKQFLDFTQATGGDTSGQPPECAWNTEYGAGCGFNPNAKPDYPVEAMDWCDAVAYCKWAGKRLCGAPGDPATKPSSAIPATTTNAWLTACTGGGSLAYPYGEFYDPNACNGADYVEAGAAAVPVGSMKTCQGGYPGIYDMTGNVFEWIQFCDPNTADAGPGADTCFVAGGNYQQGKDGQRCAYQHGYARNFKYCGFGFRCCADL